jgi:hypothetical protein
MTATGAAPATVTPKPSTNWDVLAGPIETRGQKARRVFGQFLTFLTLPSAGAVYYVYHYMTDTPERILAAYKGTRIFTVATFVAGTAFWYFNRLGDLPQRLKAQRKTVEQTITTTPLATIRKNNSPIVISNQELNEWLRYLLKDQTYDQFIQFQKEDIFDLDLEETSRELLREKYREYLKTPCPDGMIALDRQIAFKKLVEAEERLKAREITAEKEAQDAKTYQTFIDRNGIPALSYIQNSSANKQLFSKFLEHIRQKDLGWNETKKQFNDEIEAFGGKAEQEVQEEIRKLEFLSGQSYKEFQDRNGFEEIKLRTAGNPTALADFKGKFLELPYTILSSKEYEVDRNLLNITPADIKNAMSRRWLSKRYSEILKTERKDFLACIKDGVLKPEENWTTKAVLEMQNLTIQAILKDYADLFTAGVLTANDGNLKARAATETSNLTLAQLFATYGDEIFTYGLLEPAVIQRLVGDFVSIHASVYLGIDTNSKSSSYRERVTDLKLASFLAAEIEEGKSQAAQAKTHHEKQVQDINKRFDRRIKELDEDLPIKTKAEREAVTAAEETHRSAEASVRSHTQKIAAIQSLIASYEAQIASANAQLDLKTAERETLLSEREKLNNQPAFDLDFYQRQLRAAEQDLSAAEARVINDPEVVQAKQKIASLTQQAEQLEKQIKELHKLKEEYTSLQKEVENASFKSQKQALEISINTPIPSTVKGVQAAQATERLKEAAAKNRALLEAMKVKEKRFDELFYELTTQLKDPNMSLLLGQAEIIRKQISEEQGILDKKIKFLAAISHLSIRSDKVQQLSRLIETGKANQQRLQQIKASYERLTSEITALKSSRDDIIMHRDTQIAELTIAKRNSQQPLAELTTAQITLESAQQTLELKTDQVKTELKETKKQREKERSEALKAESSSYQALLQQLKKQFQETILIKSNPPPPSFA